MQSNVIISSYFFAYIGLSAHVFVHVCANTCIFVHVCTKAHAFVRVCTMLKVRQFSAWSRRDINGNLRTVIINLVSRITTFRPGDRTRQEPCAGLGEQSKKTHLRVSWLIQRVKKGDKPLFVYFSQ